MLTLEEKLKKIFFFQFLQKFILFLTEYKFYVFLAFF